MSEKHTCPRRREDGTDNPNSPLRGSGLNQDTWSRGHGLMGQKRGCSYCGSMHPDDFMQAVRDGKEVGPTDKSYKAYLHEPLTEDQKKANRLRLIASYVQNGASEEEAAALADNEVSAFFGSGGQIGKFYYQHLSHEQMHEFIYLYNSKTMKVGYPGYFYVLPYFCGRPQS